MDFLPDCPTRALDWRWRLAGEIRSRRLPRRAARRDPWVIQAVRFQGYLDGGRRPPRSIEFTALREAHRLQTGADTRLRDEVELRLLAGQPYSDAGNKCGLPSSTVEVYGKMYFDVADRLDAVDYVAALVFGSSAYDRAREIPRGVCVKIIAFNFGPFVVDHLLSFLRAPSRNDSLGDGTPATASPLDRELEKLIKTMAMPLDDRTAILMRRLSVVEEVFKRDRAPSFVTTVTTPRLAADSILSEAFDRAAVRKRATVLGILPPEHNESILPWPTDFVRTLHPSAGVPAARAEVG